MKNLLVLLGKRVHELRVGHGWSQEEFANVSGFHRTYVGQIERGEKNISFENLIKLASVLGVTASELFSVLDSGDLRDAAKAALPLKRKPTGFLHQAHEIQKLLTRLKHQRGAMDQTLTRLEELMAATSRVRKKPGAHTKPRPTKA